MDSQRLEELIDAAGFTAECYRHHGKPCVSVRIKRDNTPPLAGLSAIVYRCATPAEASDLVRRCFYETTPTETILYWPHAAWVL